MTTHSRCCVLKRTMIMFETPNRFILSFVIHQLLLTSIGVVAYGPSFVQVPPPLVLYSNNTGAVVNCVARGEPPPKIDWVDENGNPNLSGSNLLSLPNSVARRLHNGSLQFFPFRERDMDRMASGGYRHLETRVRCRASNPYGKIVSQLIVIKPGKTLISVIFYFILLIRRVLYHFKPISLP